MTYRRACITGGAGFIGSKLARQLLDQGLEVAIIDNLSTGQRHNLPEGARFIEADILDPAKTEEAIRGCDLVYHLAARVAIRSSFDFVVEDTTTNVAGTASVLRAAHRSGSVRKFVFTSSMAVYSDSETPEPVSEEHATRPVSPYGISKLAGEALTHSMCSVAGIESVALRLFNTYGPGQLFSPYVGVVTIFVNRLSAGETVTIFGDGAQARDFVHVKDIVSGFIKAAAPGISGKTFNIGTGIATTVNDLYSLVAKEMKIDRPPVHVPVAPGELRFSIAGIAKAAAELGYAPSHDLRSSISSVIEEILAAGNSKSCTAPGK